MKEQIISILFYLKKRKTKEGKFPMMLRVRVGGQMNEMSINRAIEQAKWDQEKQKPIGKTKDVAEISNYLDSLRFRIYNYHKKCQEDMVSCTSKNIIAHLQGKDIVTPKSFYDLFQEHNDRYEKLIGVEITKTTWGRYVRTLRYLKEFVLQDYKKTDLPVNDVTPNLVDNFQVFLKTKKGCKDNAAKRHLKNTKKIVVDAIDNDFMQRNPFTNKKLGEKAAKVDFLTMNEVNAIINKKIDIERLDRVRDAFIFCCFTGLAFCDVSNLEVKDISLQDDGNQWIIKERFKTGTEYSVPVLNVPRMIIEKYKKHPETVTSGKLLPILSNQKMNSYLKELADICGIRKRITTHTARHTFASTITLANNVSIQNVSKMLGHSSLKMTQHYAKTQIYSISDEMESVNKNISSRAPSFIK